MSENENSSTPVVKSCMTIPKSEFDPKIFGSPTLDSFIKLAYFWGLLMISILALQNGPVFILPLIALMISLNRYVVTRLERNLENHGEFIAEVTRNVMRETGVTLHPIQVISLWRRKSLSTVDWAFRIKPSESGESFEIVGTEFPK